MKPQDPSERAGGVSPEDDDHGLAWALGRRLDLPEVAAETLDDATLEAYRRGALDDARRQEVEAVLADDPAARERMTRLAGHAPPTPPDAVRDRALAAFDAAFAETGRVVLPWRARRRARRIGGLAMAAAVVLAAALWLLPGGPEPLPADVGWSVSVRGLAVVRSVDGSPAAGSVEVAPETRLRLDATPDRAVADVDFALFRRRGDAPPVAVPLAAGWLDSTRGAAVIEAPAGALLGDEPGRWRLLLVIGRASAMPSAAELGAVLDAERPAREEWRVHAVEVEMLAAAETGR